ncbi:porin [Enterobacteriaceae endosymbiont of Donacia proxima]|uniref:porin n=1 Tax=Enterobacteriaceae endosymbiont of Donacia proxima TaxID=2675782 RepID=UPI001449BFA2|nr:porin [Enterobacteriaceae endosymbiont of Donacia proxima]QJC35355.1 porin [Enterobacteriaceae endosymbiont of Donacia proxima]
MRCNIFKILIPLLFSISIVHASEIYNKNGQKIDLYGSLEITKTYANNDANIVKKYQNTISNIILGFKGVTKIFNNIYGYAQFEYSLPINQKETDNNIFPSIRLGLIGLNFNHNNFLNFGRNYGILYDATSYVKKGLFFTDDFMYNNNDKFMFGRTNNLITYRNKDFFSLIKGLNIALQYKGLYLPKEDNNYNKNTERDLFIDKEKNKKGWGTSIEYKLGDSGLSFIGAYFNSLKINNKSNVINTTFFAKEKNFNYKQENDKKNNSIKAFSIGAKYEKNNIYLAAVFTEAQNSLIYLADYKYLFANEIKNLEIVGQYKFSNELKTTISYVQSEGYNIPLGRHFNGGTINFVKYVSIDTIYTFSKNLSAYISYRINLLSKNNRYINTNHIFHHNLFGIGLIYKF